MNTDRLNSLTPDFWVRLAVTIFCGGIIGLERQLRGKPTLRSMQTLSTRKSGYLLKNPSVFIQAAGFHKRIVIKGEPVSLFPVMGDEIFLLLDEF